MCNPGLHFSIRAHLYALMRFCVMSFCYFFCTSHKNILIFACIIQNNIVSLYQQKGITRGFNTNLTNVDGRKTAKL